MANIISLDFTVTFDLDTNSATVGKFLIEDITGYAGLGINTNNVIGYFDIVYPDGTIRTGSFGSPDILGSASLEFNTLDIPTDINGDYLQGDYRFTYYERTSGGVLPGDSQLAQSFKFCPPIPVNANISVTTDCILHKMSVVDLTMYPATSVQSKLITLTPPLNTGQTTATTTGSNIVYQFTHTGVYTVTIQNQVTVVSGNFTVVGLCVATKMVQVDCNVNMCKLVNCYNDYITDAEAAIAQYGSLNKIPNNTYSKYELIVGWYIGFIQSYNCQLYDETTAYYKKLIKALKCNCGCSGNGTPQLINPFGQINTGPPGPQGATGATGAQGAAGAQGQAGVSILYNSNTDSGTGANTTNTVLKTYTLPADTLSDNGDELHIRAIFKVGLNASAKTMQIFFGDLLSSVGNLSVNNNNLFTYRFEFNCVVSRRGAATQTIFTQTILYGLPTNTVLNQYTATNDFTTALVIRATGQNGTATANDVVCEQLMVELHKTV